MPTEMVSTASHHHRTSMHRHVTRDVVDAAVLRGTVTVLSLAPRQLQYGFQEGERSAFFVPLLCSEELIFSSVENN